MNKESKNEAPPQGGNEIATQLFRDYLREHIRGAMWDLMQEEVRELCGPKYDPAPGRVYRRGGSDQGVVYLGGKRQEIRRPRVRRGDGRGKEQEVALRSYQVARGIRTIEADVAECMVHGMSTRSFDRMGMHGASRSTVSRRWVSHSLKRIEELRGRALSGIPFFGLMIDGVFLSRELSILVCIGLRTDGSKMVLDFETGNSESYEICAELLRRLQARGLAFAGFAFTVLDGAPALEKAVLEFWPRTHIQRCLVHKERNLHAHLRSKDHAECSRLMERLRRAQGAEAGREALDELRTFLAARNQEALQSLDEAGERLIALHLLDVPSTLNKSLLSTNLIENVIRNYRRQTDRVCRWRTDTDQAARWTAEALLWAEQGFRKIVGYHDLPKLLAALGFPPDPLSGCPDSPARVVPASCHAPCSHPKTPEAILSPASFLPQQEVGGKNDASTSSTTTSQA